MIQKRYHKFLFLRQHRGPTSTGLL